MRMPTTSKEQQQQERKKSTKKPRNEEDIESESTPRTDLEQGVVTEDYSSSSQTASVHVITDLESYKGDDLEAQVDSFILAHGLSMVNRSWCLFSIDAIDFLVRLGIDVYSLEVDNHPQGNKILKYLKQKYSHDTTPLIFVKGEFLGGFEDVNQMYAVGTLQTDYLSGLSNKEKCEKMAKLSTRKPLFWFPEKVNGKVVRCTGMLTSFTSVACVVLSYLTWWGMYLSCYLALDFVCRILAGSKLSLLGRLATLLTLCLDAEPRSGRPKQFASMCGLMFSFCGAVFYVCGVPIVGSIFIAGLALASGLEGFLDFCLGCVFFRIGIQLGLIRK